MEWNIRPAVIENGATKFVYFALKGNVEACAFEANVEATYSAEKRCGTETLHNHRLLMKSVRARASVEFSVHMFWHR